MDAGDVGTRIRSLTAGWSLVALLVAAGALAPVATAGTAARVGATPAGQRLHLLLPLVADDTGLDRFASAVSTPGNRLYGQFESIAELSRRFGASTATRARAVRFLHRAGAARIRVDATGLFVDATMSAGRAERLFGSKLEQYRTAEAGRRAEFTAPAAAVRLPRGLRGVATGVIGLDTKPLTDPTAQLRSQQVIPASSYQPVTGTTAGCSQGVSIGGFTPNQYLAAYGFDTLQAAGTLGQGERVALIEIDGYKTSDIDTFASCFGLRAPKIHAFAANLKHLLPPGGEATLDLEVLTAAAPDLSSIDVYESHAQASDVLNSLTEPLQTPGFKPQVISASLGLCESQTMAAIGHSGLRTAESALAEAIASGISVVSASGDDGSSGCIDPNSGQQLPLPRLSVDYPASSKWVTSIGGTNVTLTPQNTIEAQSVWNDENAFSGTGGVQIGAGGGGFSSLFKRPSYQTGTVLQNQRAMPDVALLSDIEPGYAVYCSAPDCIGPSTPYPWQTVGGTSAATPLLAGGFALIDEQLRQHKLNALGLANPLLYDIGRNPAQAASVFDDVTVGNNDVGPFITTTKLPLGCCTAGPGFDEASGWGGLNFGALATIALQVEPPIVDVALRLNLSQRPYAAGGIYARVRCSGACLMGAKAVITVGNDKPFTDYSNLYHRTRAGWKIPKIGFKTGQLRTMEAALADHTRVTAVVTGAIVDPGGNFERRTAPQTLTITG